MNYKKEIEENGYVIVNVFDDDILRKCREEIINYSGKTLSNASGYSIVDFIKNNNINPLYYCSDLIKNTKLLEVLDNIFDNRSNYRFCSHNDIGVNRIVRWHKDKLNGPQYEKYQTLDLWSEHEGENHQIVKVLTYLQDHSDNNNGLRVVPGSHLIREINPKGHVVLRPKFGETIIFDQRITHNGAVSSSYSAASNTDDRILLSFGFGKNNIFTDQFEAGTIARQNDQNKK